MKQGDGFLVVDSHGDIGASAGGLESISTLLAGIPARTGMAYVYVQHLDPGRNSHLAKILSSRSTPTRKWIMPSRAWAASITITPANIARSAPLPIAK